jgi:hypothetical protein
MRRATLPSAVATLVLLGACSQPAPPARPVPPTPAAAPPATPPPPPPAATPAVPEEPLAVRVVGPTPGGGGATAEWARELEMALGDHPAEFRLAGKGERVDLTVRIDSVAPGEGGVSVMKGALVRGKTTKPFSLSYPGKVRPQAEALARNLRKYAEQLPES